MVEQHSHKVKEVGSNPIASTNWIVAQWWSSCLIRKRLMVRIHFIQQNIWVIGETGNHTSLANLSFGFEARMYPQKYFGCKDRIELSSMPSQGSASPKCFKHHLFRHQGSNLNYQIQNLMWWPLHY